MKGHAQSEMANRKLLHFSKVKKETREGLRWPIVTIGTSYSHEESCGLLTNFEVHS